jgi:hypothetical protein
MKYHNNDGDITTIYADLKAAERCHQTWGKLHAPQSTSIVEEARENVRRSILSCRTPTLMPAENISTPKAKKGKRCLSLLKKSYPSSAPHPTRSPNLSSYDNPTRKVKIGDNLSPIVENNIMECLRANANIFACSPEEMSGIDQVSLATC